MCFILDIVLNHVRPIHSLDDLAMVKPFNVTRLLGRCDMGTDVFYICGLHGGHGYLCYPLVSFKGLGCFQMFSALISWADCEVK